MVETRLLHYFLAIAREENITRASGTLHVTQSTLSKQMMELEQQLGKQLFIRGKRKLTLTEDGIFLRNRAQEILDLIYTTESAFHADEKGLSGDITICCGEPADIVLERLDKGLVDMGLMLGPVRQEKYDYLRLPQRDIFGLLMPKDSPLAAQASIKINQLKSLPLIFAEQTFYGQQPADWFGADYSTMNIVGTYNLVYNATFMVEQGIGYALCLDKLVNTSGRNLAFRPITPELSVSLHIVTKKFQTF